MTMKRLDLFADSRAGPQHDIADALDQRICPEQPGDAALLERVRDKVMQDIATGSQSRLHATVRADAQPWIQVSPGVECKLLFETPLSVSSLMRLAPGTTVPGHEHPIDEECLVLEGTLRIGVDLLLRAGDFHVGLRGVPHADASTQTGAVVFLRQARPAASATA